MTAPSAERLQRLGESLREIDPQTLQAEEDGSTVRWFLGIEGTELFAWSQPTELPHHVQLVFARVSVEWDAEKGLLTGSFPATSSVSGGRYDAYVLKLGTAVDLDVCHAALALLRASAVDRRASGPLVAALEGALGRTP